MLQRLGLLILPVTVMTLAGIPETNAAPLQLRQTTLAHAFAGAPVAACLAAAAAASMLA